MNRAANWQPQPPQALIVWQRKRNSQSTNPNADPGMMSREPLWESQATPEIQPRCWAPAFPSGVRYSFFLEPRLISDFYPRFLRLTFKETQPTREASQETLTVQRAARMEGVPDDDYGEDPIKITAMNEDAMPPMPPDEDYGAGTAAADEDDGDVDVLPDFANDEAKALHADIKEIKKRLDASDSDKVETKQRLVIMEEHLKNVGMEVLHTTDLVNAKKKEIETEDHLTQLVVREGGRYQQEFKRLQEANEQSDAQLNVVQNGIFKGNERMDQFKLEMNWNQEELEQWALAAKQRSRKLRILSWMWRIKFHQKLTGFCGLMGTRIKCRCRAMGPMQITGNCPKRGRFRW